jgi:hypothetical protein
MGLSRRRLDRLPLPQAALPKKAVAIVGRRSSTSISPNLSSIVDALEKRLGCRKLEVEMT